MTIYKLLYGGKHWQDKALANSATHLDLFGKWSFNGKWILKIKDENFGDLPIIC